MNHAQLLESMDVLSAADVPGMIWGHPGCGKTDLVKHWAEKQDRYLHTQSAATMEPTDLNVLWVIDGKAVTLPAPFFNHLNHGRKSVLFFDDATASLGTVQRGLFRLIRDKVTGDQVLQNTWMLMAANLSTDAAGTEHMPTPLRNRLVHIGLHCGIPQGKGLTEEEARKMPGPAMLDGWSTWALTNGIVTEVIAYHRWRSGACLYLFDRTAYAWPSLRSWEFVSKILDQRPSANVEYELILGSVGEAQALEFSGFLKLYRNLPSIDAILLGPHAAPIPKDPATLYAVSTALARRASVDNFDAVTAYVDRLPQEFSVLTVKDATALTPKLTNTRAFIAWAAKHTNVIV